MYPSPYVEEPLSSKVIKSFVPELRSRKCFSCFRISTFYAMNIQCTFHTYPCHGMVHLYLCICYVNLCICMSRYVFLCMYMRECMGVYVCISVSVCACVNIRVCVGGGSIKLMK